ncbi:MAG TPA: ubiquitin-like protein Pup [Methylomirabilota bacterium]|nr:ubiquitin-like protein Pup [Methylomirabilota bacterium]
MAEQTKIRIRPSEKQEAPEEVIENRLAGKGENIKKKLDSVLDEIDEVLEENAEEFVAGYIQHGGQ